MRLGWITVRQALCSGPISPDQLLSKGGPKLGGGGARSASDPRGNELLIWAEIIAMSIVAAGHVTGYMWTPPHSLADTEMGALGWDSAELGSVPASGLLGDLWQVISLQCLSFPNYKMGITILT